MPVKNQKWLEQYLTPEEIKKWFKYNHLYDGHTFVHISEDGALYWEARGVDPKRVKSGGEKPLITLGEGSHLVVVEDIISAIKVSRVFKAMPLFGSFMKPEWIAALSRNRTIKQITYWLDEDKKADAMKYAHKTNILLPSNVVFTEKDPKCYDTQEIQELVLP